MTPNPLNWLITGVLMRQRQCIHCKATDDIKAMVRVRTWPWAQYAHKSCIDRHHYR